MAKRNVKTLSICLQPEQLEKLEVLQAYFQGASRSAVIAQCIDVTIRAIQLMEQYKDETKK